MASKSGKNQKSYTSGTKKDAPGKKAAAKNTAAAKGEKTSSAGDRKKIQTKQELVQTIPELTSKAPDQISIWKETLTWLILAVCIFVFISLFGIGGFAGSVISDILFGLFGEPAWLFPVAFFLFAGQLIRSHQKNGMLMAADFARPVSLLGLYLCLCCAMELVRNGYQNGVRLGRIYSTAAALHSGGGAVGGGIAAVLCPFLGMAGASIVLVVVMIICLVVITRKSLLAGVQRQGDQIYRNARLQHDRKQADRELRREEARERRLQEQAEREQTRLMEKARQEELRRQRQKEQDQLVIQRIEKQERQRAVAADPGRRKQQEESQYIHLPSDDLGPSLDTVAYQQEPEFKVHSYTNPSRKSSRQQAQERKEQIWQEAAHRDHSRQTGPEVVPLQYAYSPANARKNHKVSGVTTDTHLGYPNSPYPSPTESPVFTEEKTGADTSFTEQQTASEDTVRQPADTEAFQQSAVRKTSSGQGAAQKTVRSRKSIASFPAEEVQTVYTELEDTPSQRPGFLSECSLEEEIQADKSAQAASLEHQIWEIEPDQDMQELIPPSALEEEEIADEAFLNPEDSSEETCEEEDAWTAQMPEASVRTAKDRTKASGSQEAAGQTPAASSVPKKNPHSTQKQVQEGIASVEAEIQSSQEIAVKPYQFPPISLLKKPSSDRGNSQEAEVRKTAAKLQETLDSFDCRATVTNYSCGPSVTRYEITLEQGVKVSKIVGLADDIKLHLAAADIRIEAPIPGKSAVGIEVPNAVNGSVSLRELLESDAFRKHSSLLAFATGKDISGNVVVSDIARMPHVLIAGATGSGKSVCINTLIMSILFKADPQDVKLIMVDPKVVELSVYNGIPHLLIPVVTDPKKASGALNWAVSEMTERYNKFAEFGVRDLKGYNKKLETAMKGVPKEQQLKKMPQIVIIVDELADLMMVAPGEVEDAICRLAQLARAAGIHLVIATQRPSVNVITGLIKANMPSRIAFSVTSSIDSRTILDMGGAEKLLGKGDMLFYPQGYSKPARVQGAFVSDEEVADVVDFLKNENGSASYDPEVSQNVEKMQKTSASAAGGAESDSDELFADAGKFIIEKDKASIGMLQRVFKIGFNRAARIMDQLADAGVVGQEEGTKPRKVLMTLDQFENYLESH